MEYLFLIIIFIAILVGETVLDNFWWIGVIGIIIFIISIIRQIKNMIKDSKDSFFFDRSWFFSDIVIVLLKIIGIAGIVGIMLLI